MRSSDRGNAEALWPRFDTGGAGSAPLFDAGSLEAFPLADSFGARRPTRPAPRREAAPGHPDGGTARPPVGERAPQPPGAPAPPPSPAAAAEASSAAVAAAEALVRSERQAMTRELETVNRKLAGAVEAFEAQLRDLREQMPKTLVRLAALIARRVIEREIEADPQLSVQLTKAAVAQLEHCTTADVHVHPEDFEVVRAALEKGSGAPDAPLVRVQADPDVDRGGCIVATEGAEVDGRLVTRLLRLEEGLLRAMTQRVADPTPRPEGASPNS